MEWPTRMGGASSACDLVFQIGGIIAQAGGAQRGGRRFLS